MEDRKELFTERRRQTRNKIYKYIYDSEVPVSKKQLADAMGLSLPTVHHNISEFLNEGLIKLEEMQKSTGGRPSAGYSVVGNIRYAIGVSVTYTSLRIAVTDILQNVISYKKISIGEFDGQNIGLYIAENLERFLLEEAVDRDRILGVGITFPGVIDRKEDSIVLSPTLRMKDISLKHVRDAIPFPTFIENDSTSGATAERFALPPDERDQVFVYLFLENGIGGSVFIDGKPYLGDGDKSGEFGHMCIVPGGRKCNCGNRGCLEAYCSAFRFSKDLGISIDDFFSALEDGNEEYLELWQEILDYLAIGINNLRMAFDCNIILGGYVSTFLGPYLQVLKRKAAALNPFGEGAEYIRMGHYPTRAGMLGAARHFTNQFIDDI